MSKLIEGTVYLDNKTQEYVIFKWMSRDGRNAIVHPVGEPDMQSMYGLPPNELSLTEQKVGV